MKDAQNMLSDKSILQNNPNTWNHLDKVCVCVYDYMHVQECMEQSVWKVTLWTGREIELWEREMDRRAFSVYYTYFYSIIVWNEHILLW